jgi:hypothetical protein
MQGSGKSTLKTITTRKSRRFGDSGWSISELHLLKADMEVLWLVTAGVMDTEP